jgi:hypothetical protein
MLLPPLDGAVPSSISSAGVSSGIRPIVSSHQLALTGRGCEDAPIIPMQMRNLTGMLAGSPPPPMATLFELTGEALTLQRQIDSAAELLCL